MRYTKKDIPRIPITVFLEALGEKPVMEYEYLNLYYAPYRGVSEPMFVVDTKTNRWYDNSTDETGNILELASLTARGDHRNDIPGYIVKMMNEHEIAKEMLAKHASEPTVIGLDINKIPLTDFMKALGQEHPVGADGNLRSYNAPYAEKPEPTLVINIQTNLWRDIKTGAYGGIYDLAYEITGSANKRELTQYIAGEMNAYRKQQQKTVDKPNPPQPKRKMRL